MAAYTFYTIVMICIICLIGLWVYCFSFDDEETLYFRFSCLNILDIEFYDYVQAQNFFMIFNKRLGEYLRLYLQEYFYELNIPYEDLKLNVEVDYQKVDAICYIKFKKGNVKEQDAIQQKILQCVNLKQKILEFYQFYEELNKSENISVFKFKKDDEVGFRYKEDIQRYI